MGEDKGVEVTVQLREVIASDLPIFFEQQLDPEANYTAAFVRKNPGRQRCV
jgi:hypothetical protein